MSEDSQGKETLAFMQEYVIVPFRDEEDYQLQSAFRNTRSTRLSTPGSGR